jgi:hypothetical protein
MKDKNFSLNGAREWGLPFNLERVTLSFCKIVGVSPSGKAAVFGTATRRFESFHPKIELLA